ncbi:MAG TPA: polysaccharide deacetylase family protein [Solirubrobacteraceae bacterium]|jgi:peptidoglycan/xylan/chitin deacetylase (PgdA/CDA1 family)
MAPRQWLLALVSVACLGLGGCGSSSGSSSGTSASRTPAPPSEVALTPDEQQAWAKLLPDTSAIPVLVYHGLGPKSDFSNPADANYGVDVDAFSKQMTLMKHAGYQTIALQTFIDFVHGKPVELPPRPVLLTFDDARADSWTGGDGILRKLGFSAVLFVDVGRVEAHDPEYMTWAELNTAEGSGRWNLQLHSGKGHELIRYGPGPDDFGASYAYEKEGEDFDGWRGRTRSDIESAQRALAEHVGSYRPLAFAPPFGNYGQEGTNDPRIPGDLLGWLKQRYAAIFTQDRNARARPDQAPPYGRIQVGRTTTGGELYEKLLSGKV